MTNTQILIIVLVLLVLWVYFQQNNQPNLLTKNQAQITKLQSEVQHYQTLYQKRVAKDLEVDQSAKLQQLTLNNQQLENNLSQETKQNESEKTLKSPV